MVADWTPFCEASDLTCDENRIEVAFGDDRSHIVTVETRSDSFILRAIVVRQATVLSHPDLPVQAWLRNRAVSLVGFRIDQKNRLVGEAWIPRVGLTAEEFQLFVRTVAIECDRFEYVLTGRDVE